MSAIPRWAAVLAGLAVAVTSGAAFAETDLEREAGSARRVKVITPVDQVWDMVPDERGVWVATRGGVKRWDRATGQWEFFTRHDGLARNSVMTLGLFEGQLYAFHAETNEVSIRDARTGRWSAKIVGEKLQREAWRYPWDMQQVRQDGIWTIFTGLNGGELIQPQIVELQQYDRETLRLVGSADLLKVLRQADASGHSLMRPIGLAFASGCAWVATQEYLVRVDPKTLKAEVVALPPVALDPNADGGQEVALTKLGRIYSIAAGENCLWIGAEAGLAKYDPRKKAHSFLRGENGLPLREIVAFWPETETLWFASRQGLLYRMDLKTEKVETVAMDKPAGWVKSLVVQGAQAWMATGGLNGLGQIDLKMGRLTQVRHDKFSVFDGNAQVLLEDTLIGWGHRREEKAGEGERLVPGIQTLDLKADRGAFVDFSGPALMVPWRERIWLVGYKSVTPLFPLEGRLGAAVGAGEPGLTLQNAPEVVGERKGKLYLQTDSKNGQQIFAFEPETGRLELLFTVPEEWQRESARIIGVTSGHVYLVSNAHAGVQRFDLSKRAWEPVPGQHRYEDRVCEALERIWWGSSGKLEAFDPKTGAASERFRIEGYGIKSLQEREAGRLEAVKDDVILAYDGAKWEAKRAPSNRPYVIAGVDRAGKATGRYALGSADGPEVAIYEGRPAAVEALEAPLPVKVEEDGTIRVEGIESRK